MNTLQERLITSLYNTSKYLFVIIKPEFLDHKKEIKEMITNKCYFDIIKSKKVILTPEQVSELYIDKKNEDYYDDLVKYMSSGPCIIMILKDNYIAAHPIKDLIRIKEECRNKFGKSAMKNCLHSSDSFKNAEREIKICFK